MESTRVWGSYEPKSTEGRAGVLEAHPRGSFVAEGLDAQPLNSKTPSARTIGEGLRRLKS